MRNVLQKERATVSAKFKKIKKLAKKQTYESAKSFYVHDRLEVAEIEAVDYHVEIVAQIKLVVFIWRRRQGLC